MDCWLQDDVRPAGQAESWLRGLDRSWRPLLGNRLSGLCRGEAGIERLVLGQGGGVTCGCTGAPSTSVVLGSMELAQALASTAGKTQRSSVAQGEGVGFRLFSLNPSCSTSQL